MFEELITERPYSKQNLTRKQFNEVAEILYIFRFYIALCLAHSKTNYK